MSQDTLAPPQDAAGPTAEQRRAIEARDRDVLLEAGAGSGKTRVLAERYCAAVSEDGVPVDRILAFTFTERAAAELRSRARGELAERAREALAAGDRARGVELRRAARETERAWLTTIHGFCRRLLASHPAAAGLDPRFRVLGEPEAARLRERAVREAIGELLEEENECVARAAAAYRWRLSDMTLALHARMRSLGVARPALEVERGAGESEEALSAREALSTVLARFDSRYEALKAARAGLDFADLELGALALLRSAPAIAQAWRERFDHIMVDEFQDTNRVQLDLVEMLTNPGATRVFRVGDENQSIYRFRNADLEVFREERERALAAPEADVLSLRGNFRSTPAVLGTVNFIGRTLLPRFAELLPGERSAQEPGADVELMLTLEEGRASGARSWRAPELDLQPPPSETQAAIVAEARFLAERLRELVDAGGAERGEIVVLLRAFTHVDAYEDALRRAGLDPYVVGGRGYWSQQQVEDVIRLLAVVTNPLDDEMLFGALSSPACGMSPDALWLIRRALGDGRAVWPLVEWRFGEGPEPAVPVEEQWLDAIPAEDVLRLREFCRRLSGLRAIAPLRPLDDLVERVMNAFEYDLALLARPGGAGRMANVRKLMRLAGEFEEHEGRDLRGFLDAAVASTRRDEREGMAPVSAEDHDGVRIMTVHAAKGLEFPVVAVPDLGRALNAGHRYGDVALGAERNGRRRFGMRLAFPAAASEGLWDLDELLAEERDAEAEEGCRLVYVAATRARDRLILSGVHSPATSEPLAEPRANDTPLRRLLPELVSLGWDGRDARIALPAPGGGEVGLRVVTSEPTPERAKRLRARRPPVPRAEPDPHAGAMPPLLDRGPRRTPVGHLSYSALDEFDRCGYRFYIERVLGVREAPREAEDGARRPDEGRDELPDPAPASRSAPERARALGFGNAVHSALEWSARHGWAEPGEEHLRAVLGHEGVDAKENLERAQAMIAGWLRSPLRRELDGALRPEAPFALPLGGGIVRGKIDLLAESADAVTVLDYKTDALAGASPSEHGERYATQRAIYALAAARQGIDVRAVHLFLDAPEEPVVEVFDEPALRAASARLEGLMDAIRAGEFAPTTEPSVALCFGCPAAARLCSRPAWTPPRR